MEKYSYLILLVALFIVPRALQRLRIPTAITSFALGGASALYLGQFVGDPTVRLLALLGIVSLFLFAGLDVELEDLRRNWRVLVQHVAIQLGSLALVGFALARTFDLAPRSATLVALALLTPSTGFILDSLAGFGLSPRVAFWIKTKAIAAELVALAVLFVTLQSSSASSLWTATACLAGIVALLPLVFRLFASTVLPYAPKSEFAFLMMVAVACGVATYELGVYYLVGAFVVGMAAQRLRARLPAMSSERMLVAVEAFASLFVPFYFFHAGSQLRAEDFSFAALLVGLLFVFVGITLRVVPAWIHRRMVFGEEARETLQISVPMLPTLVFTLVIGGILRERFSISESIYGGLIVYAIVNSVLPGLVFRTSLPEVEDELLQEQSLATIDPPNLDPEHADPANAACTTRSARDLDRSEVAQRNG